MPTPVSTNQLLIGQVVIVFAIILAGLVLATQWTASALGYQPRLGAPWFKSQGIEPVYALGGGVMLGGLLQLAVQVPALQS